MNLLLDMNLPPSLADALRSAGFNATHWSDVGDPRATDVTVLDWAASHSYVLSPTISILLHCWPQAATHRQASFSCALVTCALPGKPHCSWTH